MIENRLRIERQVFAGRMQTKQSQEPFIPTQQSAQQLSETRNRNRLLGRASEADMDSSTGYETADQPLLLWVIQIPQLFVVAERSVDLLQLWPCEEPPPPFLSLLLQTSMYGK